MKIYRVGGSVRDQLLGLPFTERDWVVTGATEPQMLAAGYRRADAVFPVFLHPQTGEEYALARTEIKAGLGYKGFAVQAGPQVTLEQDLARRDLTINAMALDADGRLIDPFAGRGDLDQGLLRHVTAAFTEDPLRLLRCARFAAQLGRWGFRVARATQALMQQMARAEELDTLSPERLWREMRKALESDQPWRFFEVLSSCDALGPLIPELVAAKGGPQGRDGANPGLAGLRRLAAADAPRGPRWPRRFAAAFFGAVADDEIEALGRRLRAERDGLDLLRTTQTQAAAFAAAIGGDSAAAAGLFKRTRAFQHPERFGEALTVWGACLQPPAGSGQRLQRALQAAQAVSAESLRAAGLGGPALGQALEQRRREAIRGVMEG